jgi:hypothetical protein
MAMMRRRSGKNLSLPERFAARRASAFAWSGVSWILLQGTGHEVFEGAAEAARVGEGSAQMVGRDEPAQLTTEG